MSRKHLLLLAGLAVLLLIAGHYSYTYFDETTFIWSDSSREASKDFSSEPFPRKIWQSWKDDSEDPTERTKGFPHKWRELNPGWRYERITDANNDAYVKKSFDDSVAQLFIGLDDPILKADFLRYLILLKEGGVWADIDVLPHQPVESWVPQDYLNSTNLVIGIENDHHKKPIWPGLPYSVQLCQYTILAKPNHPAIKRVVEEVASTLRDLLDTKEEGDNITFEDVMATTGPFAFTKVLMEHFTEVTGVKHNGDELDHLEEPQLIGDILVLPKDSFGWLPQENIRPSDDPMVLVEHLFVGSWRGDHPG